MDLPKGQNISVAQPAVKPPPANPAMHPAPSTAAPQVQQMSLPMPPSNQIPSTQSQSFVQQTPTTIPGTQASSTMPTTMMSNMPPQSHIPPQPTLTPQNSLQLQQPALQLQSSMQPHMPISSQHHVQSHTMMTPQPAIASTTPMPSQPAMPQTQQHMKQMRMPGSQPGLPVGQPGVGMTSTGVVSAYNPAPPTNPAPNLVPPQPFSTGAVSTTSHSQINTSGTARTSSMFPGKAPPGSAPRMQPRNPPAGSPFPSSTPLRPPVYTPFVGNQQSQQMRTTALPKPSTQSPQPFVFQQNTQLGQRAHQPVRQLPPSSAPNSVPFALQQQSHGQQPLHMTTHVPQQRLHAAGTLPHTSSLPQPPTQKAMHPNNSQPQMSHRRPAVDSPRARKKMKIEPSSLMPAAHNPYPAMSREKQLVIAYNKDVEARRMNKKLTSAEQIWVIGAAMQHPRLAQKGLSEQVRKQSSNKVWHMQPIIVCIARMLDLFEVYRFNLVNKSCAQVWECREFWKSVLVSLGVDVNLVKKTDKLPTLALRRMSWRRAFKGTCIASLTGHSDWVQVIERLSCGGVASSSGNSIIRVWLGGNTNQALLLRGHRRGIRCLLQLKGGLLASGSNDHTIKLWKLHPSSLRKPLVLINTPKTQASAVSGTVTVPTPSASKPKTAKPAKPGSTPLPTPRVWQEVFKSKCAVLGNQTTLNGHMRPVTALAQPKERLPWDLASASEDGTVILWNTVNAAPLKQFTHEPRKVVNDLVVLMDGTVASASALMKTIKFWKDGKPCGNCKGVTGWMKKLGSHFFAAAYGEKDIRLWRDRKIYCTLKGHQAHVTCLALLPDSRLATGSMDKTIIIWKPVKMQARMIGGRLVAPKPPKRHQSRFDIIQTLKDHKGGIRCLASLPDGRFASGADDGFIIIWMEKVEKATKGGRGNKIIVVYLRLTGHGLSRVLQLKILRDGTLASSSSDKTVKLWR